MSKEKTKNNFPFALLHSGKLHGRSFASQTLVSLTILLSLPVETILRFTPIVNIRQIYV